VRRLVWWSWEAGQRRRRRSAIAIRGLYSRVAVALVMKEPRAFVAMAREGLLEDMVIILYDVLCVYGCSVCV
jgi:hypothetical protein